MANFGRAEEYAVCSRRGTHPLLHIPGEHGNVFEFSWKKQLKNEVEIYRCKNCDKARRRDPDEYGTVPSISVINGMIMDDPNHPQHPHFCVEAGCSITTAKAKAQQVVRKALNECKSGRKRPRQSYTEAVGDIRAQFPELDADRVEEVENNVQAFVGRGGIQRSLQRARRQKIPLVEDLYNIPDNCK